MLDIGIQSVIVLNYEQITLLSKCLIHHAILGNFYNWKFAITWDPFGTEPSHMWIWEARWAWCNVYYLLWLPKLGSLYLLNLRLSMILGFWALFWAFSQFQLPWNRAFEQKYLIKQNLSKFCFEVNRVLVTQSLIKVKQYL